MMNQRRATSGSPLLLVRLHLAAKRIIPLTLYRTCRCFYGCSTIEHPSSKSHNTQSKRIRSKAWVLLSFMDDCSSMRSNGQGSRSRWALWRSQSRSIMQFWSCWLHYQNSNMANHIRLWIDDRFSTRPDRSRGRHGNTWSKCSQNWDRQRRARYYAQFHLVHACCSQCSENE